MQIKKRIIDFIKDHKSQINDNNFYDLYLKLNELTWPYCGDNVPQLTYVLMHSNVDFLSHMNHIPSHCFEGLVEITSMDIDDHIKFIWGHAFANCNNLKHITLPKTIESIGYWAFHNCVNLEYIEYLGTKEEWNKIIKNGYIWDEAFRECHIKCLDGDILLPKEE